MITMAEAKMPVLIYLIAITHPLQGLFNCMVYFRPRYLKFRERDNEEYRIASSLRALDLRVPSLLNKEWWENLRSHKYGNDNSIKIDNSQNDAENTSSNNEKDECTIVCIHDTTEHAQQAA